MIDLIVEVFLCNFDFMPELLQIILDDWGIDEFIFLRDATSPLFVGKMLLQVEVLDGVMLDLFQEFEVLLSDGLDDTDRSAWGAVKDWGEFGRSVLELLWWDGCRWCLCPFECEYFLSDINLCYFGHVHLEQIIGVGHVELEYREFSPSVAYNHTSIKPAAVIDDKGSKILTNRQNIVTSNFHIKVPYW